MRRFCSYVDIFQGCGETDLPAPHGIAASWYFRKAQCGNTSPAAVLPFGKLSCGAYSGAYPTGYGNLAPNSCGKPRKFTEKRMIKGIAHLSQTGTGAIGFYYNYALMSPFYGHLSGAFSLYNIESEGGSPGYYRARFGDFSAETTVSGKIACHRYSFGARHGRIAVDFSNDGLDRSFGEKYFGYVSEAELKKVSESEVLMSGVFQNVRLYFCVRAKGSVSSHLWQGTEELGENEIRADGKDGIRFGAVFDICGKTSEIRLAVSTLGYGEAQGQLDAETRGFDEIRDSADEIWNGALSRIDAELCNDEERTVFYSNLYHSLIKPSVWSGESISRVPSGGDMALCIDYATLWDQYKTLFPLIFTLFKMEGSELARGLLSIAHVFGYIPVCFALKDDPTVERRQARMIGDMVLYDALVRGIDGICASDVLRNVENELSNPMYADFEQNGKCELATHTLDMADACAMAAELAEKDGDAVLFERLSSLAENFKNACDFESGLLTDKSWYYEGNKWNYSFRPMRALERRIALCGGKKKFEGLLDRFFGYGEGAAIQPTEPDCYEFIEKTAPDRFEGFNNEPDMETPYAYLYCDRRDKACEVIDAGLKYMFCGGEGGLPGNNDSGGLSSCYIWNMLGIFPLTGQNVMLIGSPHVKHAVLRLSSGREFVISVKNFSSERIYVKKAVLCGRELSDFRFSVSEMMQGGILELEMQ
ncbi:MAG: glycoside hydrolase domain-containing protein [Eubacteriales bacterium]